MRVYPDSRTDPRPSTAWTTVLPKKRAETSSPPSTDWRADRTVVVLAKAPTAKPPTAPTVAPTTNLVVPWPKSSFLPALPSFDGASLAQRPCCKLYLAAHDGDGEEGSTKEPPRGRRRDARPVGTDARRPTRQGFGDGGRSRGPRRPAAPDRRGRTAGGLGEDRRRSSWQAPDR